MTKHEKNIVRILLSHQYAVCMCSKRIQLLQGFHQKWFEKKREEIYSTFKLKDEGYDEYSYFRRIDEELFEKKKKVKKKDDPILKTPQKLQENFSRNDIDDLFDINRIKNR